MVTPQELLADSNCFACFTAGDMGDLFELTLLSQILKKVDPMAATDPQTLLGESACFSCYGLSTHTILKLMLLDKILDIAGSITGGGAGVQKFDSGQFLLTVGNPLNVAHGLGGQASIMMGWLECVANDAGSGYVIGDRCDMMPVVDISSGQPYPNFEIICTGTNVIVANQQFQNGNEVNTSIPNRAGTGTAVPSDCNNFKGRIIAWR